MPGALDVAETLGPAVVVLVELVDDVAHVAHREGIEVVAERVVAGPAPDQRDEARELRRLVGVAGVLEVAEVHRPVGDDLVRDLARVAVEDHRHVAQRARVVVDRLELAGGRPTAKAVYSASVAKIHG